MPWLRYLVLVLMVFSSSPITAALSAGINDTLEDLRDRMVEIQQEWGVPGMAVGIIRHGDVVFAEGFGSRDLDGELPVDTRTLFRIGSCSKALTALSLGHAMNAGILDLDAPLRRLDPDFGLDCPWATERATLVDLLTHRSGLGRYDLLSHGSDFARAELCDRVRRLPLRAGFREEFAYSNLNYVLAAHALESATGRSWEEYAEQEVFVPLGMENTGFSLEDMVASGNYAFPHQKPLRDLGAPASRLDLAKWDTFNPAGGVISNLDDLLAWMRFCLGEGSELLPVGAWERLLVPYVGRGFSSSGNFRSRAYGLGWSIYDYRGHHLVSHSGIVSGYCANVSFMPHEGLAVVVLTNLKHHSVHDVIPRIVYDRLLGLEPYDHDGEYVEVWQNLMTAIRDRDEGVLATRIEQTTPALEPSMYHGTFENPVYGVVEITGGEGVGLVARFNDLVDLPLDHFHHDVWFCRDLVRFEFDLLGFQFRQGPDGVVAEVLVREEMAKDPVSFERVAPK